MQPKVYGLGVIQFRRGDYAGAGALFQSSLRLNANNANAYYYLGETWEKQNLPSAAFGFFEKALAINPNHRGAQQKLQDQLRSVENTRPANSLRKRGVAETTQPGLSARSDGFYEYLSNESSPLAKRKSGTSDRLDRVTLKRLHTQIHH
jgi:tetratricopeptide (TPR) repeat protein